MKPVRKKRKKRDKHQKYLIKNQIKDLKSLIKISERSEKYENIDSILLKKIYPILKKLDEIVGMENTKHTIFLQLLYYLQKLNTKNSEYLHTVILGPPGCGKCLGVNTPIRMFDSSIKFVQDIKVGDLIMGDDSTARTILSTHSDIGKLFKIKQNNGMDYIVNKYHILTLINHKNQIEDIPIYKYKKLHNRKKYRGFKKGIIYKHKNIPIEPYLVGLWLGTTNKDLNNIIIPDIKILYNLYLKIKDTDLTIKSVKNCLYRIEGKTFNNFITNYKINDRGKYIPNIFKYNSRTVRLKLLQGLLDSFNPFKFYSEIKDM